MYTKIKILSVAHIINEKGQKVCTTTSSLTDCEDLNFSHQNENIQSYFDLMGFSSSNAPRLHPSQHSGPKASFGVLEEIAFSVPFIYYAPTSGLQTEMFGHVPQSLLTWMAQDARYVAQHPQLMSYYPGGPANFWKQGIGLVLPIVNAAVNYLTSSTIVSVHSDGCFNPGACPTSPSPGAAVPAITPANTAEPTAVPSPASVAQLSNKASTPTNIQSIENGPMALASVSGNPAPANPAPKLSAPEDPAAENSVPQKADGQTFENEPSNAGQTSHEEDSQSGNPAALYQNPPQNQALPSIIINAIGGTPIAAPNPDINQDAPPEPKPAPSYVVSLAPSASAVVVNGITSPIPNPANTGASPIVTINSQATTLGAVPGLAIDGRNVIAGAPAATIQGVPVSLAPSASAIMVDGSTTPLSPGQTAVISIGSQPITASPTSQYVLDGRTLVPGAPAITISGTPISVLTAGNGVVVGESTVAIPDTAGPVLPVITLGNQVITANTASQFLVGDQTLVPGAPAITVAAPASALATFGPSPAALTVGVEVFTPNPTAFSIDGTVISAGGPGVTVDGTSISLGPSGVLNIGGSTISLPVNEASPTAYTVGGQVFSPNPTAFSIDGTTISAGGPGAVIDGTLVTLGPSGILEIGSSTISLGLNVASPIPSAYTIGNQVFTPNPTAFSIDGTTISAGGPGVTIDATVVRLGSSGILDIGSSTISLAPSHAYTAGGKVFTPNPSAFSIDGTVISAGGPGVNVDGTIVSLETSGILDIGSSKILLPPNNVYTVGGMTFTPNPTAFSIDGTTISAGGSGVTIDGTVVSLGASGILDIGNGMISLPSGNANTLGIPISLATLGVSDVGNGTIPLTTGIPALTTTTPGPDPGSTSSSSHPRSTHSGGEAHSSSLRIGRLGMVFVLVCVSMLRFIWCL